MEGGRGLDGYHMLRLWFRAAHATAGSQHFMSLLHVQRSQVDAHRITMPHKSVLSLVSKIPTLRHSLWRRAPAGHRCGPHARAGCARSGYEASSTNLAAANTAIQNTTTLPASSALPASAPVPSRTRRTSPRTAAWQTSRVRVYKALTQAVFRCPLCPRATWSSSPSCREAM